MKKVALILFPLFCFATGVYSQATASANIQATIFAPISITKMVDMDFGNVAVDPSWGGQVILYPDGSRQPTGGVYFPMSTGMVSPASFYVTGTDNYSYWISLPYYDIPIYNGPNVMYVNGFWSDPSGIGTLSYGTQNLNVGATLNVNASQPGGTYYTSTPFDVMVNYY
jgi:hypothetical protein